ncbi:hypothetical protein Fmac_020709 [Flemingia macrophylla]|uniref:Uncharacterized protein n=1 Tax=Flemingia macrophylla TaxID=520843 RepID=A0ABD1LUS5_9FABA
MGKVLAPDSAPNGFPMTSRYPLGISDRGKVSGDLSLWSIILEASPGLTQMGRQYYLGSLFMFSLAREKEEASPSLANRADDEYSLVVLFRLGFPDEDKGLTPWGKERLMYVGEVRSWLNRIHIGRWSFKDKCFITLRHPLDPSSELNRQQVFRSSLSDPFLRSNRWKENSSSARIPLLDIELWMARVFPWLWMCFLYTHFNSCSLPVVLAILTIGYRQQRLRVELMHRVKKKRRKLRYIFQKIFRKVMQMDFGRMAGLVTWWLDALSLKTGNYPGPPFDFQPGMLLSCPFFCLAIQTLIFVPLWVSRRGNLLFEEHDRSAFGRMTVKVMVLLAMSSDLLTRQKVQILGLEIPVITLSGGFQQQSAGIKGLYHNRSCIELMKTCSKLRLVHLEERSKAEHRHELSSKKERRITETYSFYFSWSFQAPGAATPFFKDTQLGLRDWSDPLWSRKANCVSCEKWMRSCGCVIPADSSFPNNYMLALFHSQQIKGDAVYEIDPSKDVEASEAYPHVKYTIVDEYLNQFV